MSEPTEPGPTGGAVPPPAPAGPSVPPEAVSLNKDLGDGTAPLDFDPYRFGAPEHPVPPEYAPPGYRPPVQPPTPQTYQQPGYQQQGYQQYPPPGYQPYGQQGYPPYGQPPPPPYAAQYPQPRTGNGKAIAALVLGIASIVLCFLSVFDAVPVILAIVFGSIALSEGKRRGSRDGHGLAVAGIVCAVIGALLAVVVSVWLYSRISDCLDYNAGSSAYTHCVQDKFS